MIPSLRITGTVKPAFGNHPFIKLKVVAQNRWSLNERSLTGTGIVTVVSFVVFWTISTIKDEKSAAKFHYIKTLSCEVVAQSIAFRVVSLYWQGVAPSLDI